VRFRTIFILNQPRLTAGKIARTNHDCSEPVRTNPNIKSFLLALAALRNRALPTAACCRSSSAIATCCRLPPLTSSKIGTKRHQPAVSGTNRQQKIFRFMARHLPFAGAVTTSVTPVGHHTAPFQRFSISAFQDLSS
jgi:hypothetical protein